MHKAILLFLLSILLISKVYAAPEDFIGAFKGSEKITLTNCNAYNGVSTSLWYVNNSNLTSSSFKGEGHNDSGDFTASGEISDKNANGTIKGTNKYGHYWTGNFNATLDGKEYTSFTSGVIATSGCKFNSEIQATKQ